jgi:ubiquinone biosynthesis protein
MPEHVQNEKAVMDNRSRLKEMRDILLKYKVVTRGITPEKLRNILEELGPTYIKLGQIMSLHSDILPAAYCDELMKLNSDVTPMEFPEVEEVINRSYRSDWRDTFTYIDPVPLGSASIAQVHRAGLRTGEEVVVKVERKGVYDIMARDIGLLKRAVRLLPPIGNIKDMVDMEMVLDEMWTIAQEEMNFLKEASNIEEFSRNNRDVRYVGVPRKFQEYSTTRVLVMEYIDGFAIDDRKDCWRPDTI